MRYFLCFKHPRLTNKIQSFFRVGCKITMGLEKYIAALTVIGSLYPTAFALAEETRDLTRQDIQNIIVHNAQNFEFVDTSLALAVARVETNFYHVPHTYWGGYGAMQSPVRRKADNAAGQAMSPAEAIVAGLAHLNYLLASRNGNLAAALTAYHRGSIVRGWPNSRVLKHTNDYVANVLAAQHIFNADIFTSDKTTIIDAEYVIGDNKDSAQPSVFKYIQKYPDDLESFELNTIWPEWKKQLYFAQTWLNKITTIKPNNVTMDELIFRDVLMPQSSSNHFITKMNRTGDYTGSSRIKTDNDF